MSRRKNRYKRRQEARQLRKEKLKQYDRFEAIASFRSLFISGLLCAKRVRFKESVQRYLLSIFYRTVRIKRKLDNNESVILGFIEFDYNERGKIRHIKSVHINERVVQKSCCTFSLYPMYTNSLIYDNSASQKYKGTSFAENRLVEKLRQYYRHYGNEGYVLMIDFKNYFDSIPHDLLKSNLRKYFTDERLIKVYDDFIDAFGDKGLGLGSETSQVNAIMHINHIDHHIVQHKDTYGYGRYMDDSWILMNDKNKANKLLDGLKIMYDKAGVFLNNRKTQLHKLSKGFTFLKTRVLLTESGRVVKKPSRDSITRERRKLKKQHKLYLQELLSLREIKDSYQAWKSSMLHRDSYKTVQTMNVLFKEMYYNNSV